MCGEPLKITTKATTSLAFSTNNLFLLPALSGIAKYVNKALENGKLPLLRDQVRHWIERARAIVETSAYVLKGPGNPTVQSFLLCGYCLLMSVQQVCDKSLGIRTYQEI